MKNEKKAAKKQTMRYTDAELSLTKQMFAENDDLVLALRKAILQLPMGALDESLLSNSFRGKPEALALARKSFLPQLDGSAPINQLVDLWTTLDFKDKSPAETAPLFAARALVIAFYDQQLSRLESMDLAAEGGIRLEDMVPKLEDEAADHRGLLARNTIIGTTESVLAQFAALAGTRDETVEETIDRLKKNSSK